MIVGELLGNLMRLKPVVILLPIVLVGCTSAAYCPKATAPSSLNTVLGSAVPEGCRAVSNGQDKVVEFECENGRSGFTFVMTP